MNKSEVLFNEKCSICNFEIKHYKKRSALLYKDCSEMGDKYLKALHVRFSDGTEISGVDAFIYVWSNTKGYGWLAKLIGTPIIFQISKLLYSFVAMILFWRFKLLIKLF
jgi:predicted DCC family thiol-disulfide oxidoreductase YuxK